MYLTDLPDILTWRESSPLLGKLQAQYNDLLDIKLSALIARLDLPAEVELEAYFGDLTRCMTEGERYALLCEPEASFRLLWPSHHSDLAATAFLADLFKSRGANILLERIEHESLPLDATSPLARSVDISGTLPRRIGEGAVYDRDALSSVLMKAREANGIIRKGVPQAWSMVRDFTKLLHYLPDEDAPQQFSSGSSGQFVGRTVIANVHLEKVSAIELSEALVHEAIHSVLYMAENQRPWVLDADLYAGPARIDSPWTGNPLPLRPYLQACFVWYGLICYWSELLSRNILNDIRAKRRLDIAIGGFQRVDLLASIESFLDRLSDEVKTAIADMQQRITYCLGEELCA